MKKLFTLVTMMILLGVNRAWAGPYVYFNESSKVLNAGATSFDFMSNQLMSSGISTSGSQQTHTIWEGWVVFDENQHITYPVNGQNNFHNGDNGIWISDWAEWHIIDIGANQFSNNDIGLQARWTLRVNFDFAQNDWDGWFFVRGTTNTYWPIQNNLQKVDGWHQVTLNGNTFWSMYGYYEAVLTGDDVTYLKENGINLHGKSITIQSVELIPPATTFDASSFDWTAETYGEVELTSGYSSNSGNAYTLNPSNPSLALNGKGGSIVFIANGKSGTAVAGYRAYYVVTVPYPDNHVWDFFTEDIIPRDDANWTDDYKSKPQNGNNLHMIKVATPNESETDGYNYIFQTNAFYIPETAGLLFDVKSARLGYNSEGGKKLVTWGGYHITSTGSNNDGSHPKFIIPQVKGGKYIKIWWDAMDRGTGGGIFRVTNLLDLEGTVVSNQFSITGVTVSGQCKGCIIFKVDGESTERKDITIEMQDQGWNDIYKIEICDEYSTDLELDDITNSAWNAKNYVRYNNEYASIVHDGNGTNRTYSGVPGPLYIQRGRTCEFEFYPEGNVTIGENSGPVATGNASQYRNLQLNDIKGTGNIKIIVKEVFGNNNEKYVLDKKETWVAVGEYTQQIYPYTWDFTDYNVKEGNLEDGLGHSIDKKYGHWNCIDATNKVYGLDTHVLVDATKNTSNNQPWMNEKIEKPLFAHGSQLTYGVTGPSVETILETEGLRVKQCDDSETELGVGDNYDRELRFSIEGGCLKYASQSRLNHKLYITIPNVTQGMWVFIKASRIPNEVKIGTNTLTVDPKSQDNPDTYDTQDDVWAYEVTNSGNVDICYQGDTGVDIKAIGVTNIFKSINLLGYATESRNHAIDHSYEGFFTNNDVNAFCILTDEDGAPYNYKGTPIVVKSGEQEVNYVPENTGVVLYKSGHNKDKGGFSVPLFYPACNVKILNGEKNLFKLNMMAPCVTGYEHKTDTIKRLEAMTLFGANGIEYGTNNEYCAKFVMSRQYYVYNNSTGTNSVIQESDQEAFYRMRLNSGVEGTSDKMGANKAYLLIPTSKLPKALWNGGNGEGNAWLAKPGLIFMDDIMSLFVNEEPISGITTSIDAIDAAETANGNDTYYTLSGMKLVGKPAAKGIYIKNGKKVFIK